MSAPAPGDITRPALVAASMTAAFNTMRRRPSRVESAERRLTHDQAKRQSSTIEGVPDLRARRPATAF